MGQDRRETPFDWVSAGGTPLKGFLERGWARLWGGADGGFIKGVMWV